MKNLAISVNLESPLIKDALENLDKIEIKKAVSGGMAVQHYIPKELYRFSCDLDLTIDKALSLTDFKKTVDPLADHFKNEGYEAIAQKGKYSYNLNIDKKEDENNSIIIQMNRRSPASLEKNIKSIANELENSKEIVTEKGHKYNLIRAEDIVLKKLIRLVEFKSNYPKVHISSRTGNIEKKLEDLTKERESIHENGKTMSISPEDIIGLRLDADLYDIEALDIFAKLEKDYFEYSKSLREIKDPATFESFLKKFAPDLYYKQSKKILRE